jgi:hypothetical protein
VGKERASAGKRSPAARETTAEVARKGGDPLGCEGREQPKRRKEHAQWSVTVKREHNGEEGKPKR